MKKLRNILLLGLIGISLVGCTSPDPSVYDVKSPCVSNPSAVYLDQPCERRTPLDNTQFLDKIAIS